MNWNNEKSIGVNKIFIIFFCGGLHTGAGVLSENDKEFSTTVFLPKVKILTYLWQPSIRVAVPLGIILWNLYRMIGRIGEDQIFSDENVSAGD